jgi:hypothetical protein
MAYRTFTISASALGVAALVSLCPAMAASAPLAMVDPTRPMTTIFDQVVRDGSVTNEDVIDLFGRANVGTKVVVLPDVSRRMPAEEAARSGIRPTASRQSMSSASAGDGSRQDSLASAFGLY